MAAKTGNDPPLITEIVTPKIVPAKDAKSSGVSTKLIPLKSVIFMANAGMAGLYPFITLHMKDIGISLTDTAVISFLVPLLSCLLIPFICSIADRIGHYKILILILTVLHVTSHMLLLSVPSYRIIEEPTKAQTEFLNVEFDCNSHGNGRFSAHGLTKCQSVEAAGPNEMQFEMCSAACPDLVSGVHLSVCYLNASSKEELARTRGHACSRWEDLYGQVVKEVHFEPAAGNGKGEWGLSKFRDDEGGLHSSLRCLSDLTTAHRKCTISCIVNTSAELICSGRRTEGSRLMTILLYFFLRLLGQTFLMSMFIILDTATLQLSNQHGGTFGVQRVFAAVAWAVIPPFAGYLIDEAFIPTLNYIPAFLIYGVCNLFVALIVCGMTLPKNMPQQKVWKNVGKILNRPLVISVLAVMFVLGMGQGYAAAFLYWFLRDRLGADKWLLGLGSTVSNLASIPLYIVSQKITRKLGFGNILVLILLINFGRYVAYSYLVDPLHYLAVELCTACTFAVVYTLPAYFSQSQAPKYVATLQGLIQAITFGMGFGCGPLLGGYLIEWNDYAPSFRIFSLIFLSAAVLFASMYYCWLRKLQPEPASSDENQPALAESDPSELDWDADEVKLYQERAPPKAEFDPEFQIMYKDRPWSGDSSVFQDPKQVTWATV